MEVFLVIILHHVHVVCNLRGSKQYESIIFETFDTWY